jgi:predicted RNA-binding protein YlqC (UPF0109 family)
MMEWIESFVKDLVGQPDQVSVSNKEGVLVQVVNLKVATEDLSMFDGKNNRLTRALGSILSLAGVRDRVRYVLKVVD